MSSREEIPDCASLPQAQRIDRIRQVSWLPGYHRAPPSHALKFQGAVAYWNQTRRLQLREQRRMFAGFPIIHAFAQTCYVGEALGRISQPCKYPLWTQLRFRLRLDR
jgi:hypothetical protein